MKRLSMAMCSAALSLSALLLGLSELPVQAQELIYACIQKNNGQSRIVSAPSDCRPSEVAVFWNKVGPQGLQGPKGEKGDAGSAGHSPVLTWSGDKIAIDGAATGPNLTGPQGLKGEDGAPGPATSFTPSELVVSTCFHTLECYCPSTQQTLINHAVVCPYNEPPVGYYLRAAWLRCATYDALHSPPWFETYCAEVGPGDAGHPTFPNGVLAECTSQYVYFAVNTIASVRPDSITVVCCQRRLKI